MASISVPAHCQDYSVNMAGTAVMAIPAQPQRSFLMIQGPVTGFNVVFSFTNPNPATGSAGSFTSTVGSQPIIFGPQIPDGPLYVFGTGTGVISILAG
jgi:hypothetical protein